MSDWPIKTLDEIFEIARGGSPRPIDQFITDENNGVNWVMISDASASDKFIYSTKKRIRPEGVSRSRRVKVGDFILTNSMSFGRPYIMATDGCIHDGWLVLSARNSDVDQNYYYYLLSSPAIYREFSRLAGGSTVKNLNIDLVKGVKVPHPPLKEQERIAKILDQAALIKAHHQNGVERSIELLDSLSSSAFGGSL
jgi:type I restriction enzyme, S subunit